MIIGYGPDYFQDTVSSRIIIYQDTLKSGTDTLPAVSDTGIQRAVSTRRDSAGNKARSLVPGSLADKRSIITGKYESNPPDTTSVCVRSPVADVTFYNPDYVIRSVDPVFLSDFPFRFLEKNIKIQAERKASLEKHLHNGQLLPNRLFHD